MALIFLHRPVVARTSCVVVQSCTRRNVSQLCLNVVDFNIDVAVSCMTLDAAFTLSVKGHILILCPLTRFDFFSAQLTMHSVCYSAVSVHHIAVLC